MQLGQAEYSLEFSEPYRSCSVYAPLISPKTKLLKANSVSPYLAYFCLLFDIPVIYGYTTLWH